MAKVIDKATAFKNEISGSTTNKIVCKAASHEVAGPKKKHVDCECLKIHLEQLACYLAKGWVGGALAIGRILGIAGCRLLFKKQ